MPDQILEGLELVEDLADRIRALESTLSARRAALEDARIAYGEARHDLAVRDAHMADLRRRIQALEATVADDAAGGTH